MLSVAEALARILSGVTPLKTETIPLTAALDRVLAADIHAKLTQPPFRSSMMDGYAVRAHDVRTVPKRLQIAGESAAGHPFAGTVAPGQAVRIFTGAALPDGADFVVIQENVTVSDSCVDILELSEDEFIRPAGNDFFSGQMLLPAGKRLSGRDLMLAAQANHTVLPVVRRPVVCMLASGDELVQPGETPNGAQIVSSIPLGLAALIAKAGGEPKCLGIARDTLASLSEKIEEAASANILVTIGGASVGEYDLVRPALLAAGYTITFHSVAMRPGKPLMFGSRGAQRVLGLPGNPASAIMGAVVFLAPLIAALLGERRPNMERVATLTTVLPANGPRQSYMRAKLTASGVEAMPLQDSALISRIAAADCVIIRPPHAPAAKPGDPVTVLPLDF